jgi:ABC-type transport system involved in Fe-S cluster assembly fused permease/ATPase subunit
MESFIPRKNTSHIRTLLRGTWFFKDLELHHWGALALSGVFVIATIMLSFALPIALRTAVNTLEQHTDGQHLWWALLLLSLYATAWLSRQITIQVREICAFVPFERVVRIISHKAFAHMLKLPMNFHLHRRINSLTGVFKKAQQNVPAIYSTILYWIAPLLIESFGAVAIVFRLFGGFFAGVLALTIICYGICISYFADINRIYRQRFMDILSRTHTQMIDSLMNVETVKAFNREDFEHKRLEKISLEATASQEKSSTMHTSMHLVEAIILGLGITAFSMRAASLVTSKVFTIGDFVMLHGYVLQFASPLSTLGHLLRNLQVGLVDLANILDVLDMQPSIHDQEGAQQLTISHGEITFNDVHFAYNPARPIVNGLSLTIKPQTTVGIVGASGSGKSTLARLLTRQFDINSGSISIDSQPIKSVTLQSLRQSIALVPQECTLFNASIFYNIAYGNPQATREEVLNAARTAQLEDFIATLPHQYETLIGERGMKLSGGERQRVAVARALLKKSAVYVFDEATSALDNQTERALQKGIASWCKDSTTIVIAHRLTTIANADTIFYIESGAVAEQGSHHELLERNGKYAALWRKQQRTHQTESAA